MVKTVKTKTLKMPQGYDKIHLFFGLQIVESYSQRVKLYTYNVLKWIYIFLYSKYCKINERINALFQINASYLINAPSTLLKFSWTPLSNKCPLSQRAYENYSKILGISKKEQNHSTHSVTCLMNKALHMSSCSMSSLKEGFPNDGNTITLSEDSDIDVEIWKSDIGSVEGLDVSIDGPHIVLSFNSLDVLAESILLVLLSLLQLWE